MTVLTAIPCRVTGVYGTLHTSAGDLDTGAPRSMRIDCETLHFEFVVDKSPVGGVIHNMTLHFGVLSVLLAVDAPRIWKGDRVHVMQSIVIDELFAGGRELPAWAA